MKQHLLLGLALAALTACKKDDDPPAPVTASTATVIGMTTSGIFMWDHEDGGLGYLWADDGGGWINRGTTAIDYPLDQLANEDDCRVEWTSTIAPDGSIVYVIHMTDTEDWWYVAMSSGRVILKQGYVNPINHLPTGIPFLWRRHTIGSHNGHALYAMESYQFPNMYWSAQGTMGSWLKVHLDEHSDLAHAQGFMFR